MRIDPGLQLKDLLATNRKRGCFYLETQRGMSFAAARTLLEEQKRIRRSRRERLTLWIAVASVLVAVIATTVAVLSFLRNDLPWSLPATGVEAGQDENRNEARWAMGENGWDCPPRGGKLPRRGEGT